MRNHIFNFFFLGGGVGASPVIHDGIGVESMEPVSAGVDDFLLLGLPSPVISSPKICNKPLGELLHLRLVNEAVHLGSSSSGRCSHSLT